MIVLDTDIISNLMRPRPSPALVARLQATKASDHCTTSITMGELSFGAHKAGRPELYERARRLLSGARVLDFDLEAAELYGAIRSQLESTGARLADPDLRIAATVLAHEAVLVTGNLKHFSRVPELRAEDWLRA